MNSLSQIAKDVQARLEERTSQRTSAQLLEGALARVPQKFTEAFQKPGPQIIAEVKFRSPSQGSLAKLTNPVEVAGQYLSAGACALSVLTEQDHFGGSLENLKAIRGQFPQAFLLMKDFIIHEDQILEARAFGADAVLVIVSLLGRTAAQEIVQKAHSLGLSTLTEVHDANELAIAAELGSDLIGVNNRNLKTLKIDLAVSRELAQVAKTLGVPLVSESGIQSPREIKDLAQLGYSSFLMGTTFMKAENPGAALSAFLKGCV